MTCHTQPIFKSCSHQPIDRVGAGPLLTTAPRCCRCSNRGMYGFKPECRMDCPQEYADIVAKCLSTDPSKRPTFKELVVKLEECMHLLHSASLHGASTDDSPKQ